MDASPPPQQDAPSRRNHPGDGGAAADPAGRFRGGRSGRRGLGGREMGSGQLPAI